jgi:hypothetical protein
MKTCRLFDKYRDGELDDTARIEYERHLRSCEDCGLRMTLLNNLVHVMKKEEIRPRDLSAEIARRAFQPGKSWDALIVSLLRPAPALAALALFVVLCSTLWVVSEKWQRNTVYEYQKLMDEADAIGVETRVSDVRTDSELVIWLEQEGVSE